MKSINTLLLLCAALLLTADTLAEEAAPAKTLRPYAFKKGLTISYDINTSRSMNIGGQSYPRNLKATELLVVMNEEVTSTGVKQYRILSSTVIKDSAESDQLVDLIPTVFYVNEFGEMMRPGVSDLLLPIPTESGTTVTLNRGAFNVDAADAGSIVLFLNHLAKLEVFNQVVGEVLLVRIPAGAPAEDDAHASSVGIDFLTHG